MSHHPRISAIICTYNRCELLPRAIESLAAQTLSRADFEVIVVDNGSTDDTTSAVAACQRRYEECRIRLVAETRQGLSHARNTGFREARGTYVAYLDDDAVAAPGWLESGLRAFQTHQPAPRVVVGPVIPTYPEGKPSWFNDRFETFQLGESPVLLTGQQSFCGGNAMFEKQTLEELAGFQPGFGMVGEKMWLGEEVELLLRMRQRFGQDCGVLYEPRVSILHAVSRSKLTVRYVLQRRFRNGECNYIMRAVNGETRRFAGTLRSLAWTLWLSAKALAVTPGYRSPSAWLTERGAPVAVHLGEFWASLQSDFKNSTACDTLPDPAEKVPAGRTNPQRAA